MAKNDRPDWMRVVDGGRGDGGGGSDHTGGGNGTGGGDLERRVEKLESTAADIQVRLVRIETRLEQTATKADLSDLATSFHKSMNEQTWKFLGGASGLAALFSAIAVAATKLLGS